MSRGLGLARRLVADRVPGVPPRSAAHPWLWTAGLPGRRKAAAPHAFPQPPRPRASPRVYGDAPAFTRREFHHHPTYPPSKNSAAESKGISSNAAFRGRNGTGVALCRRGRASGCCGLGERRYESWSWTRPPIGGRPYSRGSAAKRGSPLAMDGRPSRPKKAGESRGLSSTAVFRGRKGAGVALRRRGRASGCCGLGEENVERIRSGG
jgi:hypothetical protein